MTYIGIFNECSMATTREEREEKLRALSIYSVVKYNQSIVKCWFTEKIKVVNMVGIIVSDYG